VFEEGKGIEKIAFIRAISPVIVSFAKGIVSPEVLVRYQLR
jgi:hypothetical protein